MVRGPELCEAGRARVSSPTHPPVSRDRGLDVGRMVHVVVHACRSIGPSGRSALRRVSIIFPFVDVWLSGGSRRSLTESGASDLELVPSERVCGVGAELRLLRSPGARMARVPFTRLLVLCTRS